MPSYGELLIKTNNMKNIIYFTITFLFSFSLFYLLGSFYSVSFDISKWSDDARSIVSVIGGLFSFVIGGFATIHK